MTDVFKYNGFKLIRLELIKNSFLGTISYDFIESVDDESIIYTTVIIGPNGTGKSNLFRTIIELFREIYNLNNGRNRVYQVKGLFRLCYSLNGDIYTYSNIEDERYKPINYKKGANNAYLLKNDKLINFNEAIFPLAIVANSLTITDKYPVYTKDAVFPQYKYLGVRNTPQNASTRSYVRKTVDFIVENQDSNAFKAGLRSVTKFLGVNEAIEIYYSSINGYTFFSGELTSKTFIDFFEKIEDKYKGKEYPPQKLNYFRRIAKNQDKIKEIVEFCNALENDKRIIWKQGSTVGNLVYNLISEDSYAALKAHGSLLNELRQLGIVSAPEIGLSKGESYSLQESSSGEYHLLSSIVGLMATAKINSLIFLDEPESSLHPNWQMKYLSFIRELFSSAEYGTSHIVVATHSHYLISDLKGDSSKIIGLKRAIDGHSSDKRSEIVNLPYNIDTYGWSAEEVLYKIFDVKTTRNYYLESDLRELLHLISSRSKNTQRMTMLLNKIKALHFSVNDPINLIIEKADTYLQS